MYFFITQNVCAFSFHMCENSADIENDQSIYFLGLSSFSTSSTNMVPQTEISASPVQPTRLHFSQVDTPHLLRHLSPSVRVTPHLAGRPHSINTSVSSTHKKPRDVTSFSFYRSEKKLSSDIKAAQQFKNRAFTIARGNKHNEDYHSYRRSLEREMRFSHNDDLVYPALWKHETMQTRSCDDILSDESLDMSYSAESSSISESSDASMEWDFEDIFDSPSSYNSGYRSSIIETPCRKQVQNGYENEAFDDCTDSDHVSNSPAHLCVSDVGYSNFAFERSPRSSERRPAIRRRSRSVVRRVSGKRSMSQGKISRGGKSLLRVRNHPMSMNLKSNIPSASMELGYLTKYFQRRSVIARRNHRQKKSMSMHIAQRNKKDNADKRKGFPPLYFDNRAYSCDDRLNSVDSLTSRLKESDNLQHRRVSMPVILPTQMCGGVCLLTDKDGRRRGELCDQCTASISRLSNRSSTKHTVQKTQQQGPADYEVSLFIHVLENDVFDH